MERCYMRMCMYNVGCPTKESKNMVTLAEYTKIIIDYNVVIYLLVLFSSIFASPNAIKKVCTVAMLLVLFYETVSRNILKPIR